jgi:hypothetical protein
MIAARHRHQILTQNARVLKRSGPSPRLYVQFRGTFTQWVKQILIFRNLVKPQNKKYFASHFWKSELQLRHPWPTRGALRGRHET